MNIVQMVEKNKVSKSTLMQAIHFEETLNWIMHMREGRGRKENFIEEEGLFIVQEISEFQNNGVSLDRSSVRDIAQTMWKTIPHARINRLAFANDWSGTKWLNYFLKRHDNMTVKRRVFLKSAPMNAINPQKVEPHIAWLNWLMESNYIENTSQLFNLDESGFFKRGTTVVWQ